jgi:hypothetical protein
MKARIIKRTHVDGQVHYVIQQKHWFDGTRVKEEGVQ